VPIYRAFQSKPQKIERKQASGLDFVGFCIISGAYIIILLSIYRSKKIYIFLVLIYCINNVLIYNYINNSIKDYLTREII
jgi:uncharacterized membrane protein